MQAQYRTYQQQTPSRSSPHVATGNRRGIGPMVQTQRDQREMMNQNRAQADLLALKQKEVAKKRAIQPTDKTIPDGVEEFIIGDGVQRYKALREVERRLDATMTRKRLDIREAVDRNIKRHRTLRIWVSNTAEDQPWQSDTLDVDAFDFSTNMDSSYRVKIEGRLLDDEDEEDSDDSDDEDEPVADGDDPMDEDKKKKNVKPIGKLYRLSHFFKSMTVDFDRSRTKDGADQNVEWKKPSPAPNLAGLPAAADFDQLEFKRGGDENCNIMINLVRDETPERFQLSEHLVDILDTNVGTREEVTMGIWSYIKAMGLADDDEKRTFELDDRLRPLFPRQEKGYWPQLGDAIISHTTVLQPIRIPYTIRVDKEFHENPQPTIYDVEVTVEDPLRAALDAANKDPDHASSLREITALDKELAVIVRAIAHSKSKHSFFDDFSMSPTDFILKWLSSQKRDLEIISGDGPRGGGEDATSDEWRRGGKSGVWGSKNVKEVASLMAARK